MRIIFLSNTKTIILDIVAWLFIHLGIGYTYSKIPVHRFDPQKSLYQIKKWEKDGEIYQNLFRVKTWKKKIPSGASVYANTFKLKNIKTFTPDHLERWIKESCRAESCHWTMILPGFLFFLWNSIEMGWLMVLYAVLNNLVPIIMQRFNRPRIQKLLTKIQKKSFIEADCYSHHESQNALLNPYL